jgi:hypothetical protein
LESILKSVLESDLELSERARGVNSNPSDLDTLVPYFTRKVNAVANDNITVMFLLKKEMRKDRITNSIILL